MDSFENVLTAAQAGNSEAMQQILLMYEGLIVKSAVVDGEYDEDCRQYITLEIVRKLPRFKIIR